MSDIGREWQVFLQLTIYFLGLGLKDKGIEEGIKVERVSNPHPRRSLQRPIHVQVFHTQGAMHVQAAITGPLQPHVSQL